MRQVNGDCVKCLSRVSKGFRVCQMIVECVKGVSIISSVCRVCQVCVECVK